MEKICGIYCIENIVNGKKYVGQSIDIHKRLSGHRTKLIRGKHKNQHLQNSWNKYGESSFKFYILEECKESMLDQTEINYINKWNLQDYNYGYNIESGGNLNKHLGEETKMKLREAHLGVKLSEEVCKKMSDSRMGKNNSMYGKCHTQETKDKISKANKGKPGHKPSEYQLQRAREANIGKIVSDETKKKLAEAKKGISPVNKNLTNVFCVELNMKFDSASDAAKELNIRSSNILECCKGVRNTAYGFHWKFADEIQNQEAACDSLL